MPYIGNTIRAADDYRLIDDISSGFNGSTTSFALQVAGSAPVPFPKSPQQVLISVNGVIQEPDPTGSSGFNLVGTNIVFSSAPTNGHAFFGIIYATADYLNAGGNFPAGSLGAPSITFIGDENTGLFRKSGGSVGFVSDATEIANFDSNGITISSGNIIIPDSIIHNGDTNTKIRFPSTDTISAETAGTEALRITSTGRLGINEINPGHKLVVGGDIGVGFTTPSDAARQLNFNVNRGSAGDTLANINWQWNSKFVAQIRGIAGADTTNKDDAALGFFTSAANNLVERLRIQRDGNIGAGTSDPYTKFHIQQSAVTNAPVRSSALYLENNANCEIQFVGNSSNDCQLRFGTSNNSFLGAIEYELDNANMEFYTGGSERLRIDSSGNVGIGITAPSDKLHVRGASAAFTAFILDNATNSSNPYKITFGDQGQVNHLAVANREITFGTNNAERMRINNIGQVQIGDTTAADTSEMLKVDGAGASDHCGIGVKTSNNVHDGYIAFHDSDANFRGQVRYDHSVDAMFFNTAASERMRIDTSGRLIIGTTTQFGDGNDKLMIENGTTGGFVAFGSSAGFSEPIIGSLRAYWADNKKVAAINLFGGSDTTNKDDGSIRFATSSANNLAERMRINSNGYVSIGTTDNSYPFHVKGGIVDLTARFENTKSGNNDINYIGVGLTSGTTGVALFGHTGHSTSTSQAAWIGNAGDDVAGGVGVRVFRTGKVNMGATGTSNNATLTVKGVGVAPIACTCNSTSGHTQIFFVNGNGNVGQINTINSETRYFTTSDYRLKENVVDLTGAITRLKTLQPKRFNWISDETNTLQDGFLAHEVTAVPEAISGTKDKIAVQADVDEGLANNIGDPVYQSIDHSKLVPLLVAALQEEIAKRESLETRIAALESA